jgi:hypothetical protein
MERFQCPLQITRVTPISERFACCHLCIALTCKVHMLRCTVALAPGENEKSTAPDLGVAVLPTDPRLLVH